MKPPWIKCMSRSSKLALGGPNLRDGYAKTFYERRRNRKPFNSNYNAKKMLEKLKEWEHRLTQQKYRLASI